MCIECQRRVCAAWISPSGDGGLSNRLVQISSAQGQKRQAFSRVTLFLRDSHSILDTTSTEPDVVLAAIAQSEHARDSQAADYSLEYECTFHRILRLTRETTFQCVHEKNENGSEELSSCPADRAANLGTGGVRDLNKILERTGKQGERSCS